MMGTSGRVLSVQVGRVQRIRREGRSLSTAMVKRPVSGPVPVGPLGLAGDAQADLRLHGGPEQAVYAHPSEHYAFWQQARREAGVDAIDEALPWGSLAENLTLQGLLERDLWVGDVLEFPHCALQVTRPRTPCHKLAAALGFAAAVRLMAESGRTGFYLSVLEPGTLAAGEAFELVPGPRQRRLAHARAPGRGRA